MFLLPAFIRLEHECQDLLSLWDGMHVWSDWTLVCFLMPHACLLSGITDAGWLGVVFKVMHDNNTKTAVALEQGKEHTVTECAPCKRVPSELFWGLRTCFEEDNVPCEISVKCRTEIN